MTRNQRRTWGIQVLSGAELSDMRDEAELALPDTCEIQTLSLTTDGQGGNSEVYATTATVAASTAFQYDTANTPDAFKVGVATAARQFWIMENGDLDFDRALAQQMTQQLQAKLEGRPEVVVVPQGVICLVDADEDGAELAVIVGVSLPRVGGRGGGDSGNLAGSDGLHSEVR